MTKSSKNDSKFLEVDKTSIDEKYWNTGIMEKASSTFFTAKLIQFYSFFKLNSRLSSHRDF